MWTPKRYPQNRHVSDDNRKTMMPHRRKTCNMVSPSIGSKDVLSAWLTLGVKGGGAACATHQIHTAAKPPGLQSLCRCLRSSMTTPKLRSPPPSPVGPHREGWGRGGCWTLTHPSPKTEKILLAPLVPVQTLQKYPSHGGIRWGLPKPIHPEFPKPLCAPVQLRMVGRCDVPLLMKG